MVYDKKCDYELTNEERSLITCATGLLYAKKHYRNYLFLAIGHIDNLIKFGLVQKDFRISGDSAYYWLTEEGIKVAYQINGYKVPNKIEVNI